MTWYVLLIGVVAVERLAEVVVANRNRAWSQSHGGVEFGARHYPAMVALHTGLLAGCLVEVIALHRLIDEGIASTTCHRVVNGVNIVHSFAGRGASFHVVLAARRDR